MADPSMMGLALNTLNGYRESGEGYWLDNADADTLRDMVRIVCKITLDRCPRCAWAAGELQTIQELLVDSGARVEQLEAALREIAAIPLPYHNTVKAIAEDALKGEQAT